MKYRYPLICLLFFLSPLLKSQDQRQIITGQVSFRSSQNVYVRFSNTSGISVHDTLFISSGGKLVPVLIVNDLSGTSCLCSPISSEDLPAGHLITAKAGKVRAEPVEKEADTIINKTPVPIPVNPAPEEVKTVRSAMESPKSGRHERISGSLSAASYSDFSNTAGPNDQRFRYNFSLNALNIADSRVSGEAYVSFRHRSGAWNEVKQNIFTALKIYSLAIKYDIDTTARLKLGRQINTRISNIGAFDGLVFEKSFSGFTAGITGGSRPDFRNYGFDFRLLQYGAYLSYDFSASGNYSSTSLAFMEQLYSGKTDRRFLYLQHSGTLMKNLSLFGSFELDLFKLVNNKSASSPDLTSLYLYLNYRVSGGLSLSGSYDARRNPVYYETNRTLLDTLKENALRQSYRLQARIRLSKSLMLGVQSSYRFLKTDVRKSESLSGYLSYSRQGKNYFSATLSGDYISTNYIKGYSGDLSFLNSPGGGKVQLGAGYRFQQYRLPESQQSLTQHTGRADVYWQPFKKISLSLDYELTVDRSDRYNRVYIQILKRF